MRAPGADLHARARLARQPHPERDGQISGDHIGTGVGLPDDIAREHAPDDDLGAGGSEAQGREQQ